MTPITPSKLELVYQDACRVRAYKQDAHRLRAQQEARQEAERMVPEILKYALYVAEEGLHNHYSVPINQMNPSTNHVMQLLLEGGYRVKQPLSGDAIEILFEEPPEASNEMLSVSSKDCASDSAPDTSPEVINKVPQQQSWLQKLFRS